MFMDIGFTQVTSQLRVLLEFNEISQNIKFSKTECQYDKRDWLII